ncbi:hypothetical protein V8F06_014190 [Rhypophila decipiens]
MSPPGANSLNVAYCSNMPSRFHLRKLKPDKVPDLGPGTLTMDSQSQIPASPKMVKSHFSKLAKNLGQYNRTSDRENKPGKGLDIEPHVNMDNELDQQPHRASTELQSKAGPYATIGITEARDMLRERDGLIDKLRGLAINDASNTITRLPGQSTLQMPESEIVNRWKIYIYEVHNLVNNLLHASNIDQVRTWAASNRHLEFHQKQTSSAHVDRAPQTDMVEAVIWKSLVEHVFGAAEKSNTFSKALWAGPYAESLSELSATLSRDLQYTDHEKQSMFHQWKSLTTSFISTMAKETSDGQSFHRVVERLEMLLQPLGERAFGPERRQRMITTLVRNAIDLDRIFCGQQCWYLLKYPKENEDQYETKVNVSSNETPVRSSDGNMERSIRPILYRAGNTRGEDYTLFEALG